MGRGTLYTLAAISLLGTPATLVLAHVARLRELRWHVGKDLLILRGQEAWWVQPPRVLARRAVWHRSYSCNDWPMALMLISLVLPTMAAAVWASKRVLRRWMLLDPARYFGSHRAFCPKCGYDLRATPERCPECGLRFRTGPPIGQLAEMLEHTF